VVGSRDHVRGGGSDWLLACGWCVVSNREVLADLARAKAAFQLRAIEAIVTSGMEPRDNPRQPIFRDHNCWACRDGEKPCREGNYGCCSYPRARND
jgi:hypothetical protein